LDYLGLAVPQVSVPDDFGGYAGISNGLTAGAGQGQWLWVFGTDATYAGLAGHLIDNGQWARYEFPFVWSRSLIGGGNSDVLHIMLEDYVSSGGTASDAYFDNVELSSAVPEPTTLLVWSGLGAMGLVMAWRRRKRAAA